MTEPWNHPELEPLLLAARRAKELLDEESRVPTEEVKTALDDIYKELGKRLVQLASLPSDPPGPPPLETMETVPEAIDSEPETVEFGYNTETVSEESVTPIPLPTPPSSREKTIRNPALPPPVFHPQSTHIPELPHGEVATWKRAVLHTMRLMESPKILHAYTDLSVEISCLLWSAQIVDDQRDRIPTDVLSPMLSLLAARCNHLSTKVSFKIGVEITMDLLKNTAEQKALGAVPGLRDNHEPEYQNWFEDAQHWWDVLAHGMEAQLQ